MNTGTGFLGKSWCHYLWRYLKPNGTLSWETFCRWRYSYLGRGWLKQSPEAFSDSSQSVIQWIGFSAFLFSYSTVCIDALCPVSRRNHKLGGHTWIPPLMILHFLMRLKIILWDDWVLVIWSTLSPWVSGWNTFATVAWVSFLKRGDQCPFWSPRILPRLNISFWLLVNIKSSILKTSC